MVVVVQGTAHVKGVTHLFVQTFTLEQDPRRPDETVLNITHDCLRFTT